MSIKNSLCLLPLNNQKRITMNKMRFTLTFNRLGPAVLLLSFFIGGCGGPTEYRYNDSMKTYTAANEENQAVSTAGQHNKATAHYILRPGDRPDFQPRVRQMHTVQQPAAGNGESSPQLADLQMVLEVSDILFEFDKWVIKKSVVPELDQWAAYFKNNPEVTAEIYGHADSVGPSAYNMDLSRKRAQAVVNYLTAKGITSDRLTAKGFGESRPAAPNSSSEGRQKNRRVELKL
jgi:outer membrane protein OmpA-like peptidoglycan-associated protein